MALVKGKAAESGGDTGAMPDLDCAQLARELEDSDAGVRRHAARRIGAGPEAAAPLLGRLKREQDIAVREAILNALVHLGDASDSLIAAGLCDCLRSEDAALRNQAIEAMKQMDGKVTPVLRSLLADPDADLRIFAVNILESRCGPDVEGMLIEVIEGDANVNVCAAALDLLCEIGTEAAAAPLARLKARFASDAYIQFAVGLALERIRE